ncbi:MAG: glucosyltransferase domain-containing protein, partial [Lachnospiraceae bacterium]|nr:glucosyltransferase domain-containing protein [Lachnospiraceae bacterium]
MERVKEFIDRYRGRLILISVLIVLIHFSKLNNAVIGIDTEDLIREQRKFYQGWLGIGRYGLVLLKRLFGGYDEFNPYFTGLMTLVFLIASIFAFFYLWEKASGNAFVSSGNAITDTVCWTAGAVLWASHPVITEQLYFSLQSMEVCFSILLTALALLCILKYQECGQSIRRRLLLPAACLLLLVSFSTYQSFVELYIFGTVSVVLLKALVMLLSEDNETSAVRLVRILFPYIAVFIVTFVGNMISTRLFFAGSSYLTKQIEWGNAPVSDIIASILKQAAKTLTGVGFVHYDFTFGILTIFTLGLILTLLLRHGRRKKGSFGMLLFLSAALVVSPYLLLIICGGNVVVRSQLALPALTGFYAYT